MFGAVLVRLGLLGAYPGADFLHCQLVSTDHPLSTDVQMHCNIHGLNSVLLEAVRVSDDEGLHMPPCAILHGPRLHPRMGGPVANADCYYTWPVRNVVADALNHGTAP